MYVVVLPFSTIYPVEEHKVRYTTTPCCETVSPVMQVEHNIPGPCLLLLTWLCAEDLYYRGLPVGW